MTRLFVLNLPFSLSLSFTPRACYEIDVRRRCVRDTGSSVYRYVASTGCARYERAVPRGALAEGHRVRIASRSYRYDRESFTGHNTHFAGHWARVQRASVPVLIYRAEVSRSSRASAREVTKVATEIVFLQQS